MLRLLLVSSLALAALGQTSPPATSQLEAMQRFAEEASTRITWSQEVEHISAGGTKAVITAVILRAGGREVPGIRIDLSGGGAADRVYVSLDVLEHFIAEMDEIATRSVSHFERLGLRRAGSTDCFGSGILLGSRREGAHIFGSSQCRTAEGGRWLSVTTGESAFRFDGLTTAPFVAAMARAREALAALGQTNPAIERFAEEPSTRVVWSQEVERISGGAGKAVITAVILQGGGREVRGIRIDISEGGATDRVYASPEVLQSFFAELERNRGNYRGPGCYGSGIALGARREGVRTFGGSQCVTSEGASWFSVTTGPSSFRFDGLAPAPFASAMARAREVLSAR